MNMSKTVSVIRRQSLAIDSQFYPPTETIPQIGQYSIGWYGHVCEDYDQKMVLAFFFYESAMNGLIGRTSTGIVVRV